LPVLLWTKDQRLIFTQADSLAFSSSNLWYLTVDSDTGIASGESVQLTHWDRVLPALCGLSKDGKRLIFTRSHSWVDVVVGALKDNGTRLETTQLTNSDSDSYPAWWSRDGKFLLISSDRAGGRSQIYRQPVAEDVAELLTSGPEEKASPELTPDGQWMLYWATRPPGSSEFPNQTLMRTPTAGATAERILETPGTMGFAFHCPTVAKSACVLSRVDKDELIFYSLDPVKGQGVELTRTKVGDPGTSMVWALSPDGKNIAVTGSRPELSDKVRVIDLQTGRQRELPTPSFVFGLSWSPDGSALYGAAQGVSSHFSMLRLELSGKSQILLNRDDFFTSPVVSPDGRSLAFGQQSAQLNVYSLENF
jgi:Tol biopolymer transport system component